MQKQYLSAHILKLITLANREDMQSDSLLKAAQLCD
jgi:hypothetical protein